MPRGKQNVSTLLHNKHFFLQPIVFVSSLSLSHMLYCLQKHTTGTGALRTPNLPEQEPQQEYILSFCGSGSGSTAFSSKARKGNSKRESVACVSFYIGPLFLDVNPV